ncbi:MAG TPA: hypothetical protein PLA90_15970, partial [Candidatus Sumerlaeota bacterium]|nr:hypothetical protein [Candidatus Sumerlaeota bacterium]
IRVCALVAFVIILSFDCACPAQTPSGTHQNPAQAQDPVKAKEIGDRFLKYRESFEKSEASEYPTIMNEMLKYAFAKQEENRADKWAQEGIANTVAYMVPYSMNLYVQKIGRPLIADDIIKVLDAIDDPNKSVLVMRQWGKKLYRGLTETERDKFYAYIEGFFEKKMAIEALLSGTISTAESMILHEKVMLKQDKEKANQTEEIVAKIRKRDDEIQRRAIRLANCLESTLKRVQKQEKYDDSLVASWLGKMHMLGKHDPEVKKIAIRNLREACLSTTNSLELRRSCATRLLNNDPDDPDYNSAENRDFIKKLAESEKDENLRRSFQAIFENAEAKAKKVNP